jgi:RNA polymerase sigma factor (sigma-70 family)
VTALSDTDLLKAYAERRLESAFTELVHRHVDFVYSAALRVVYDPHLAEDVTQGVFIALAKQAPDLVARTTLAGWLHRTAQNIASQTVRTIERRRAREQEAIAMNELISSASEAAWEQIAPHLDAALGELTDADRDAVLMRYYEKKTSAEMGSLLGITAEAAQKRVSRAVEELRDFFAKRGVIVGAGGLVVLISANVVQSAPVGLAAAISAAALAGTAVTTSSIIATTTKTIAMTTLQKAVVTTTVAILAGTGIYEARQAARLRDQVQVLQQQKAPMAEQIQELQHERDDATNRLAGLREENEQLHRNTGELLRLRAEATRLRNEATDAAAAAKKAMAAGKDAMAFQSEVRQVLSNTPPIRTLVATSTANVPWNDTVVMGGWKTPGGKRAIVMANVAHKDGSVMITSRILEYTEAAGVKLGLSRFNTDEPLPTKPSTLTSEQANELLKLAQGSEGVDLLAAPRVTTSSGSPAQIQVGGMYSTPSGQKYLTGPVLHVNPNVSPDGQSVQLEMTAELNYLLPIPTH